jgi:hypothetical protein
VIFSSNIIKTPESSTDGAHIEKRKRKAPRVSSNEWGSQYFEKRKNTSTSKILFDVISFSPPLIPFQKPFPKSLRKFS